MAARVRLPHPLIAVGLLSALVVAAVASYQPLYLGIALAGSLYLLILFTDPALGLAAFTLLTFFGELGHGASPIKAAGALIVLVWLLELVRRDRPAFLLAWSRPVVFNLGVALIVWAGASVLWAADPGTAKSTAVRLTLNLMLFVVVPSFVSTRRDLLLVVYAYVFGAASTALYGVASGNAQSDASGRLAGGIGDPNELAALLVPGIVLAIVLMIVGTRKPLVRLALALAVATDLFALVAAQSRGGFVALGAATLASIVFAGRQRTKITLAVGMVATLTAAVVTIAGVNLGRLSSLGGGTGRVDIWSVAIRVFERHPLAGVGIGNFTVVEPQFAADTLNLPRVDLVLDEQKVAHNTYLNVLTDLGLVGLCLFGLLILLVLRALVARIRVASLSDDRWLAVMSRGLTIALIGLLVAYVFISAQYEKQLWLLLGVALATAGIAARRGEPAG